MAAWIISFYNTPFKLTYIHTSICTYAHTLVICNEFQNCLKLNWKVLLSVWMYCFGFFFCNKSRKYLRNCQNNFSYTLYIHSLPILSLGCESLLLNQICVATLSVEERVREKIRECMIWVLIAYVLSLN